MRHLSRPVVLTVLVLAVGAAVAGCKSDSPTMSNNSGGSSGSGSLPNGSMTATFDGAVWNATVSLVGTYVGSNFTLSGVDPTGLTVSLAMSVSGPGTVPFSGSNGGSCTVMMGSATWLGAPAALQGSGTIVFTTLNATSATGTFRCTALPQAGTSATGTKELTNGAFTIRF